MDSYDDLVARSQTGDVTAAELAWVKAELAEAQGGAYRYALLYVLGRSLDMSATDLVERFLVCPKEPALSRLALQVLCVFWDRTDRYLDYVMEYAAGVPWDLEDAGMVRAMALSIAGRYLRDHRHPELLRQLLAVARDPRDELGAWEKVTWDAVIVALGRALGYADRDLPRGPRGFDPDDPLARQILARAEQRLERET
jgi:hypothetical protein